MAPLLLWTRSVGRCTGTRSTTTCGGQAPRAAGVSAPGRAEAFTPCALLRLGAADDGVSIRALADCLGHADPAFTLRVYTQPHAVQP